METDAVYSLIMMMLEYIKPNEREEAFFAALNLLVDEDVDLKEYDQKHTLREKILQEALDVVKKMLNENS